MFPRTWKYFPHNWGLRWSIGLPKSRLSLLTCWMCPLLDTTWLTGPHNRGLKSSSPPHCWDRHTVSKYTHCSVINFVYESSLYLTRLSSDLWSVMIVSFLQLWSVWLVLVDVLQHSEHYTFFSVSFSRLVKSLLSLTFSSAEAKLWRSLTCFQIHSLLILVPRKVVSVLLCCLPCLQQMIVSPGCQLIIYSCFYFAQIWLFKR